MYVYIYTCIYIYIYVYSGVDTVEYDVVFFPEVCPFSWWFCVNAIFCLFQDDYICSINYIYISLKIGCSRKSAMTNWIRIDSRTSGPLRSPGCDEKKHISPVFMIKHPQIPITWWLPYSPQPFKLLTLSSWLVKSKSALVKQPVSGFDHGKYSYLWWLHHHFCWSKLMFVAKITISLLKAPFLLERRNSQKSPMFI